ncbi:11498_t:CDS:2 [Ambispora gerdemannii]|uniref:11498_t:CDS:1 n=1 Tax=Ambispora gerdemannii TaxID=144530 RepID=A0A9N9FTE4_9GLOM|nr:11498_t:CDS:2 [Ambispora gerdemannii]
MFLERTATNNSNRLDDKPSKKEKRTISKIASKSKKVYHFLKKAFKGKKPNIIVENCATAVTNDDANVNTSDDDNTKVSKTIETSNRTFTDTAVTTNTTPTTTSNDTTNKDITNNDTTNKDTTGKDATNKDTTGKDTTNKDFTGKDTTTATTTTSSSSKVVALKRSISSLIKRPRKNSHDLTAIQQLIQQRASTTLKFIDDQPEEEEESQSTTPIIDLNTRLLQQSIKILAEIETEISQPHITSLEKLDRQTSDINEQINGEDDSKVKLSEYDVAWIAMIPDQKYKQSQLPRDFKLAFPECFLWLLKFQDTRGSWTKVGTKSIAPSLSALLALGLFRARAGQYFKEKLSDLGACIEDFNRVFSKGETFLRENLNKWSIDEHKTATTTPIEMIVSFHLKELEKFTPPITFDFPAKERLSDYQKRMNKIPADEIFSLASRKSSGEMIHPLEILVSAMNISDVQDPCFYSLHGSSPAVTAAVLISDSEWNNDAYKFLRKLISSWRKSDMYSNQKAKSPTNPDFESCWIVECVGELIFNASSTASTSAENPHLEEVEDRFEHLLDYIRNKIEEQKGLYQFKSFDNKTTADINHTALALHLLAQYDSENRINVENFIQFFWTGEYFNILPRERTHSSINNIHALNVLLTERDNAKRRKEYPIMVESETVNGKVATLNLDYIIQITIEFIQSKRTENFVWTDEWHSTPWYTTLKAIKALLSLQQHQKILATTSFRNRSSLLTYCRSTIDYALKTQHCDGSWGEMAANDAIGNLEETSYVIRLLQMCTVYWSKDEALASALKKGREFLLKNFEQATTEKTFFNNHQPPLWGIYTAPKSIQASMLCALWN